MRREDAFVQYMQETAVCDAVEENMSSIRLRWSTSDDMDYIVCDKALKHRVGKVKE